MTIGCRRWSFGSSSSGRIVNGTYELRGVEVTLEGSLEKRGDDLYLVSGRGRLAVRLAPLTPADKIQWNHLARAKASQARRMARLGPRYWFVLAAKGHRVDVYERFSSLYDLPRAVYFDDEIMQVWQSLGITGELDLLPIKTYNWFGADGDAIFRMEHPGARPVGLGARLLLLPAGAGAGPRSARARRCPPPPSTAAGAPSRSSRPTSTSR